MGARRVRVVAKGDVQGVFFRDSTQQQANDLGVTGWVRNREDGDVEVEIQGEPDQVEQMVDFCRSDPGSSTVRDLDVDDIDVVQDESSFQVQS